jgi:hypothetical protein
MGSLPINFVTPGPIASADIVVNDSAVYQSVWGFGASLSACYFAILHKLSLMYSNHRLYGKINFITCFVIAI